MSKHALRVLVSLTCLMLVGILVLTLSAEAKPSKRRLPATPKAVQAQPVQTEKAAEPIATPPEQPPLQESTPAQPAAGEEIAWSVMSSGGSTATAGDIAVDCSIGQIAAGFVSAAGTEVNQGFLQHFGGGCCVGERGNVDMAGIVDSGDLTFIIDYLAPPTGPPLPCYDEANINGEGIVDSGDLTFMIDYLSPPTGPALPTCP